MSFSFCIPLSPNAKKEYPTMLPFTIFFAISIFSKVVHSSETTTEPFPAVNSTPTDASEHVILAGKHESLASCALYVMDADEFRLLPNGSAFLFGFNRTIDESSYWIRGGKLYVCSSHVIRNEDHAETEPSIANFFAVSLFSKAVHSSETTTESFPAVNSTPTDASEHVILAGKHESLASCTLYVMEADEFRLLPNGSAFLFGINKTIDESSYLLRDGELHVCQSFFIGFEDLAEPAETEPSIVLPMLTVTGMAVSMISLFLHLVAFSMVPDLRNLPGWNLATLCLSLLISYLLSAVNMDHRIPDSGNLCLAMASMTHFFFLASIIWMTIISYDVFISLVRATSNFRSSKTKFNKRKYGVYCACAYGTAFVFAVFGGLTDRLDFVPIDFRPGFGEEQCWFKRKKPLLIFFAGPVFILSFVNFVLFGLSAYVIHANKMKQNSDEQSTVLKRRYLMYFRLSVIMGATWIVGIVASIYTAVWVKYLFTVLNTLQGFFIFLAFTCSKKVRKFFRQKLLSARRSSEQKLTKPTFQSYCFYANSIEKDLDKVVESSKGKIDTIMIHI